MIETLPLDEFDRHFENIFEAIVAVAKRARQINQIQKQLIDAETEALSNGNFDDEGVSKDFVDGQYIKLPKPTTIALQEMLQGKLVTRYPGED
jgi:DNA-directed RNA polymerase subunit K/omega